MTRPPTCLPASLATFALLVTACPSDEVPVDEGNETTAAGDGDGDPGDGDGDPGDGDGDPGDGDGDGDGDEPMCGDGTVDPGEECDDGNTDDGDGCSPTCALGPCGLAWTSTEAIESSAGGGLDVAVGADGSVYVAGISLNATNDAWVAKWNPDGTQAWAQSFGVAGNDAAAAIALGPDGVVYVAGWFAGAGDDIWYAALDSSGAEQWSVQFDGGGMEVMDGDDRATGIAPTPDGDLVVVGRVRVGDGDDDVWVRKAAAADGGELWSTTWSGTGDGMFSTDRSGQVAVASSGDIWVGAREHIDFDSQDATLLHFDADGNLVASYQPQGGGNQQQDPIDVAVSGDAVYFAFAKFGFPYRGWLYKLGFDGSEQWSKTEADWVTIGEDWIVRGIGLDDAGALGVAGVYRNEEEGEGIDWGEAWVAKLDGDGNVVCRSSHMVDDGNLIPPSLSIDGAGFSGGGFGLTGIETAGQGNATMLWTGFFAP